MPGMSAYPDVVTSPATCTRPVVTRVSTATRLVESCVSRASRMASLIWSQILSGWPSVTDSEVNRRWVTALLSQRLLTDPRVSGRESGRSGPLYRGAGVVLSAVRVGREEGADGVPDRVRHGLLAALGHLAGAAAGVEDRHGVACPAEDRTAGDVVDDEQVAALAGELGTRVGEHVARGVPGLGGEPDHDLARRALRDEFREHVHRADQVQARRVGGVVGLLDLAGG